MDVKEPYSEVLPDEWPRAARVEEEAVSPFFVLRQILRTGRILPTWSLRKTRNGIQRTVYGKRPVVCFTEMPLAAFLIAGRERSRRGEKMSPYGLMFSKRQLFERGARPAIYGLDKDADFSSRTGKGGARFLSTESLPLSEQFRYVAFDPTRNGTLDWSHEREWRWPTPDAHPDAVNYAKLLDLGLNLHDFKGTGFVVKTERQAELLLHDILRLVDSGAMQQQAVSFILVRSHFPDPTTLIPPHRTRAAIAESRIDLKPYFSLDDSEVDRLLNEFDRLVETVAGALDGLDIRAGELGKCWLWLRDNTSNLVRALVSRPNVRGVEFSSHGHYLVNLPEFRGDTGLRLRQKLTSRLATLVEREFDTPAADYAVLGSDDPDGIPYTGFIPKPGAYLNYAHDEEDF